MTARADPEKQGTVFDRLFDTLDPALEHYQWHAVGRLDRDTTGLLLFTNDEQLVQHVTSPASKLEKVYRAHVGGHLTDDRSLRQGMALDDGSVAQPAQVRIVGDHEVELTLTEGRNHQAKRMLGGVGLPVMKLHRVGIGTLSLDLPEAGWRELTPQEIRGELRFPSCRSGLTGTKAAVGHVLPAQRC